MPDVLILNHGYSQQCGVHAHGKRMGDILASAKRHTFHYRELTSANDLRLSIDDVRPDLLLFNYHPSTMPWLTQEMLDRPALGMIHEVTQDMVGKALPPFDQWVCTDPSLTMVPGWHKTVRPLFEGCPSQQSAFGPPKIGTFGFAFANKGFRRVVEAVCAEYDEAVIRMHVTRAHFHGSLPMSDPMEVLHDCQSVLKDGISLDFSFDHRSDQEIVSMLGSCDLNCLFYDDNPGRGVSSAVDYCVSSGAPLIVTKSEQFRHIIGKIPVYPQVPLAGAMRDTSVLGLQQEWSNAKFKAQYEDITDAVLAAACV